MLDSVEVIIPTRDSKGVIPPIIDDLKTITNSGGSIVILESIDDPERLAAEIAATPTALVENS